MGSGGGDSVGSGGGDSVISGGVSGGDASVGSGGGDAVISGGVRVPVRERLSPKVVEPRQHLVSNNVSEKVDKYVCLTSFFIAGIS